MEKLSRNNLSFQKIILSMIVIMLVWAVFWYPFDYFYFSKNSSDGLQRFLSISREFIRLCPAVCFFIYYKHSLEIGLKDIFSFKFNYKMLMITAISFMAYFLCVSYFTHGKIYFNLSKMQLYDVVYWFSLALCQELVFRGWSFWAFSKVTSYKNAIMLSGAFFFGEPLVCIHMGVFKTRIF